MPSPLSVLWFMSLSWNHSVLMKRPATTTWIFSPLCQKRECGYISTSTGTISPGCMRSSLVCACTGWKSLAYLGSSSRWLQRRNPHAPRNGAPMTRIGT